jgi:hypothetical protein
MRLSLEDIHETDLPKGTQALLEVIGFHPLCQLIAARGGAPLSVPRTPQSRVFEELCGLVGAPAAQALVRAFGGETVYIPNGKRALARALHRAIGAQAGERMSDIARRYGVSVRWVFALRARKAPPPAPTQPRLF